MDKRSFGLAGGWTLAVVAAWLLAMAIVLRVALASGMDLGFGDRADGLIEISLLEHWHRWLVMGGGEWRQALYFYPYDDTLGYNDGYFLFGLIFSFWRRWFDPFLADTLNVATWKTIGFFASYGLVARVLGWQRGIALLIAVLFTIANGMTVQALHSQLQLVALVPVIGSLGILLFRAEQDGRRRTAMLLAVLTALVLAAWLITGFYLAWFTLYFLAVGTLAWFWTLGPGRWSVLRHTIAAHWPTILVFALVFAVACVPFLLVYGPKLHETGGHDFKHGVMPYLITPIDIANVGRQNYLWGWIFGGIEDGVQTLAKTLGLRVKNSWIVGEHCTGFPLLLLALILTSLWRTLRAPQKYAPAFRIFALAVAISWALTLQLKILSPWHLIYWGLPGAKGVRVILRYQLWLILPALILVAGVWRDRFTALYADRPLIAALLVGLLLVEQINGQTVAALSRKQQLAELAPVPAPPAQCPAFYIVNARGYVEKYGSETDAALFPHNVDAMLLAQLWGKPTINGVSTFNSPDWNFAAPDAADYDARVARYARDHHLQSLCRLDVRQKPAWRQISYR